MSGKKATITIVGIVFVCMFLIYFTISAFYKHNPHQPNQKSLDSTSSVVHNL